MVSCKVRERSDLLCSSPDHIMLLPVSPNRFLGETWVALREILNSPNLADSFTVSLLDAKRNNTGVRPPSGSHNNSDHAIEF